jgi:hypothetical protein
MTKTNDILRYIILDFLFTITVSDIASNDYNRAIITLWIPSCPMDP